MAGKVYLAGPSRDLARVLPIAERLEAAGVTITHKWWVSVMEHGVGNDGELTAEAQRGFAAGDLQGINSADLVWALWPQSGSHGTAVELGYAIAKMGGGQGLMVVASGHTAKKSIFTALATCRAESDDAAFAAVMRLLAAKNGGK